MSYATTATAVQAIASEPRARSEAANLLLSIARGFLVAVLLAAPLALGAVQPWAWASLTVSAVLLLLLWAASQVLAGRVKIFWSPLYVPGGLLLALALAQYFGRLTLDSFATRESILKLATDLVFFFLAIQLFAAAPPRIWRRFGFAVAIFAFSLALFAILQYFSSQGLIYWAFKTASGCTFGPYANHNHYAGLMEMLIPIGMASFLVCPQTNPTRRLLGFAVLVAVASVLISGSRGGFIALLAELGILGLVLFRYSDAPWRRPFAVMVGLGAMASALLFFWIDPGHISRRLATVANLPQSPEVTLAIRWNLTQDSLRMLSEHMWVGTGAGSYEVAYTRYQSFPIDLRVDYAHNDYAQALGETGLVGGVLIVAALAIFLRLAFTGLRKRLRHDIGWIQLGATLGCCGLLVHSFGDFNLHIPANAAWFAVCAAMATQRVSTPKRLW